MPLPITPHPTLLPPAPPLPRPCPALQTVQRLLACAVADPSVTVRRTILEALSHTSALETHLAQAECLRSLFVALNDESSAVRSLTIQLAGAISPTNPAYVMPALRRHLMQLLSDMDHSPDSRQREGGQGGRGRAGHELGRGGAGRRMRAADLLQAGKNSKGRAVAGGLGQGLMALRAGLCPPARLLPVASPPFYH